MQLLARMRGALGRDGRGVRGGLRRNKTEELAGQQAHVRQPVRLRDVLCTGDQEFLSLTCLDNPGRCITRSPICTIASCARLPPGSYIYHYNCLDPDAGVLPRGALQGDARELGRDRRVGEVASLQVQRRQDDSSGRMLRTEIRRRCPYAFGFAWGSVVKVPK